MSTPYELKFYGKISNHAFINYNWIADDSGVVVPIELTEEDFLKIHGMFLTAAKTIPDPDYTPTDNYDVEIIDEDGMDLFGGTLQNRSNLTTQLTVPHIDDDIYGPVQIYNNFSFRVSNNSVANAKGVCRLFLNK